MAEAFVWHFARHERSQNSWHWRLVDTLKGRVSFFTPALMIYDFINQRRLTNKHLLLRWLMLRSFNLHLVFAALGISFASNSISLCHASSPLQDQELVPVTSRKTVGWGSGVRESPPPTNATANSPALIKPAATDSSLLNASSANPALTSLTAINPQEEEQELTFPEDQTGELPLYTGGPSRASELITQRYSDGKPQVTRRVMQDEEGNFLNHGPWKLFSRRGQTMAEGSFKEGLMHGSWQRWHPANSPGLFAEAPFTLFQGPFLSTTYFKNGKQDGIWTIYDKGRRKIFELPFKKGVRDGRARWYFPTSRPMREVDFKNGLVHGQMIEYDREGKKTRDTNFVQGQELIVRTEFYFKDQKKLESNFIGPKTQFITEDDWWNAAPAQMEVQGNELQHGATREWYANGQMRLAGQYKQGQQIGSFRWWHANGQKQIQGQFREGAKVGTWVWRHANSAKAIEGDYQDDQEVGLWRWWDENGDLENERDFSRSSINELENVDDFEGIESIESREDQDSSNEEGQLPNDIPEDISAPAEDDFNISDIDTSV